MTRRWLRAAVAAAVLSSAVALAAPGYAIEGCGIGMYYNNYNSQCEPWAPIGVDFAPAFAAPAPLLDAVPIGIAFDPIPIGIGFDPGFGFNIPNVVPYLRVPGIPIPGVPGIPIGLGFLPGFGLNVPNIAPYLRWRGVPGIPGIPAVRLPGDDVLRVPDVRVPGVPDVRVPDVRVPDVRVPDVRVPDVRVPDVHAPHRR